jgi:hypothetical protein
MGNFNAGGSGRPEAIFAAQSSRGTSRVEVVSVKIQQKERVKDEERRVVVVDSGGN